MGKAPLLLAGILLAGCASSFKSIDAQKLGYKSFADTSGLAIQYNLEPLFESGNRKYAHKAEKMGLTIAAVKVKNTSDREIQIGKDGSAAILGPDAASVEARQAIARNRQLTGLYALFLLGMPINIYGTKTSCDDYSCSDEFLFIPVGIIIGPVLTLINCLISSNANTRFHDEIGKNDLLGRTLKPGEEAAGYLVYKKPRRAEEAYMRRRDFH